MLTSTVRGDSSFDETSNSEITDISDDKSPVFDFSLFSILIVEDETYCFQYLEAALKRTKAILYWVSDGQSAIDFMRSKEKIHLILMDMKMPVMDGFRATEIIKQEFPNIPIIAQTAYAMPGDREKCLKVGCDYYLPKPYNSLKLCITINDLLIKIPS